jgi:NADPH:quinone reductase-like Zn-dependent oxidoreductase
MVYYTHQDRKPSPKLRTSHMKAALCKTLDGPGAIVIEDVATPKPGPGEVSVAVKCASLNFLDTLITRQVPV